MLSYRVEFIVRRVFLNLFTKINTPPDNLTNNILAFNLAKYSVYFYIFWECKIVCVNRYCMNLLYAPYWGKQR